MGKGERLARKDRKFENSVIKVALEGILPSGALFLLSPCHRVEMLLMFQRLEISLKIYRRVSMSTADSLVFAGSIEKHGLSVTGRIATLNMSLHL